MWLRVSISSLIVSFCTCFGSSAGYRSTVALIHFHWSTLISPLLFQLLSIAVRAHVPPLSLLFCSVLTPLVLMAVSPLFLTFNSVLLFQSVICSHRYRLESNSHTHKHQTHSLAISSLLFLTSFLLLKKTIVSNVLFIFAP